MSGTKGDVKYGEMDTIDLSDGIVKLFRKDPLWIMDWLNSVNSPFFFIDFLLIYCEGTTV